MDEAAARQWLLDVLRVPRETIEKLELFTALLRSENEVQNLVSRSSLEFLWARHIVDSAQLVLFAPAEATWLDLGTGAGFPGLIVGALHRGAVTLVEPRKLRVDFLRRAAELIGAPVVIASSKIEAFDGGPFDVISARAFAPLARVFDLAQRFSAPATRWILPKGKNAKSELEAAESLWQGDFRLEPSLTDPDARIVIAERVRRRDKRNSSR